MNMIFAVRRLPKVCALALAAALAGPVCAAEPVLLDAGQLAVQPIDSIEQLIQSVATPLVLESKTLTIGDATIEAVDLGQLDHERGRADTIIQDTRLNGDVANNSAVNVQTGSNSIDTGSFANMSGIPVVIQNSGANVLIQNATVINLQLQ